MAPRVSQPTTTEILQPAQLERAYTRATAEQVTRADGLRRDLYKSTLDKNFCDHTLTVLNPLRQRTVPMQIAISSIVFVGYWALFLTYEISEDFVPMHHFTWWMWTELCLYQVLVMVSVWELRVRFWIVQWMYPLNNGLLGSVALLVTVVILYAPENLVDPATGQVSGTLAAGNIVIHYMPLFVQGAYGLLYAPTIEHTRRCMSSWTRRGAPKPRRVFVTIYAFLAPAMLYLIYTSIFNVIVEYQLPSWVPEWLAGPGVQFVLFSVTSLAFNAGLLYDVWNVHIDDLEYIEGMLGILPEVRPKSRTGFAKWLCRRCSRKQSPESLA